MEVPLEPPITPDTDYSLSESDEGVHTDDVEFEEKCDMVSKPQLTTAEVLHKQLSLTLAGIRPDLESLMNHEDNTSLIEPKKVVSGGETRDQKEITRQLKWNHDKGIDVLYQNELQKSFQKRRETVKKKELLDSDEKLKFEKTIQMQASKLKNPVNRAPSLKKIPVQVMSPASDLPSDNEFQRIHSRIAQKSMTK